MNWVFRLGALVALLIVLVGVRAHRFAALDPADIAWLAHACALAGALFGVTALSRTRWRVAVVAAYVGWRVAFFPVLVLSGHAAAVSEWLLGQFVARPLCAYPILFLGLATGTAIAARLTCAAVGARSWRQGALCAAPLMLAVLMSFTGAADLDLLPDRTPWHQAATPAPRLRQGNVYRDALARDAPNALSVPLLWAAAMTYDLIPDAPWAARVQGTLEAEFLANPRGASTDRVREHFQAFSAAHTALVGTP